MSSFQSQPEYLEPSAGGGLPPERPTSRTKTFVIGGLVLAAVAVTGAAAWGVYQFVSTGPQPAEALPATTIAYASIDLDPSGSQKIEAYQFLKKFPAISDQVTLDSQEDLRRTLFEAVQQEGTCAELDFDADVAPWLGSRAAVAGVDVGSESPVGIAVLQVTDADAARTGLDKLAACDSTPATDAESDAGYWTIEGDWAIFGAQESDVTEVVGDLANGTLADDEDFQHWVGEAGDSGIVTLYAAPELGSVLLDQFGPLLAMGQQMGSLAAGPTSTDYEAWQQEFEAVCEDPSAQECTDFLNSSEPEVPQSDPTAEPSVPAEIEQAFTDFGGAAAVLGFDDGALQLSAAFHQQVPADVTSASGADDVVADLPDDTVAALGYALGDGWAKALFDQYAEQFGADFDEQVGEFERATGLTVPEDAQTLLGERGALVVGGDFTVDGLADAQSFSDLPVGLVIEGDRDGITGILDKLREAADLPESDAAVLEADSEGDRVVVGPNADLRRALLSGGSLGDSDTYRSVIPDDDAAGLLYVDFDGAGGWLTDLVEQGGTADDVANVEPLRAFGISGSADDDVSRLVIRLSTN